MSYRVTFYLPTGGVIMYGRSLPNIARRIARHLKAPFPTTARIRWAGAHEWPVSRGRVMTGRGPHWGVWESPMSITVTQTH